jgi:hypothetical protein
MYLLLNSLNQDLFLSGFVMSPYFSPDCSENPILFRMDCNEKREIAPKLALLTLEFWRVYIF